MTVEPTGRLVRSGLGDLDLLLNRTFRAPIMDVWASVTESPRLARWFGSWSGEAGAGQTVTFQMTAEEGAGPEPVLIRECDPPRRLVVDFEQGDETWRVSLSLSESAGETTLAFAMRLPEGHEPGDSGPGWEYYLDRLVADGASAPMPDWDAYYPAQQAFYVAAASAARSPSR